MKYLNLLAELVRNGMPQKKIPKELAKVLKKTPRAIHNKIYGPSEFKGGEIKVIMDAYFADSDLDATYLFDL